MQNLTDEQIKTIVMWALIAFIVIYFVLPKIQEGFSVIPSGVVDEESEGPHTDRTGSIIVDGAGSEKGEIEQHEVNPSEDIPDNYYFLDDGAGGRMSIQHNLSSKSCCAEQYPTPFKLKKDPYVCANKGQFVASNIMSNNSFQDSGCNCLTKEQAGFIYNRGGNGREWF